MICSKKAIDLLKSFEGCKLKSYQDVVGIWTIGYGHVGPEAIPGVTITQDKANDLLSKDLIRFEDGVGKMLKVNATQGQFDALVCFAFNVGLENLRGSHLLNYLNKGDKDMSAEQFLKWNHAGGVVVPGLTRRREAEKALFVS